MQKVMVLFLAMVLTAAEALCAEPSPKTDEPEDYQLLKEIITTEFSSEAAHEWGETVSGVKTRLKTDEKVLAVALDTCPPATESDQKLIQFFATENIPATLFVCGAWIDQHPTLLKKLAANPLFEIANDGLTHRPCSINGKSAAGIQGTRNPEEVFAEIEKNARKIEAITGFLPQYYRAGAGYYDEVAVRIAKALGYEVIGSGIHFSEETWTDQKQLVHTLQTASAGAVAIFQTDSMGSVAVDTVIETVRKLRAKGFKFVKLSDYPLE